MQEYLVQQVSADVDDPDMRNIIQAYLRAIPDGGAHDELCDMHIIARRLAFDCAYMLLAIRLSLTP
jgi:hypothetical protein